MSILPMRSEIATFPEKRTKTKKAAGKAAQDLDRSTDGTQRTNPERDSYTVMITRTTQLISSSLLRAVPTTATATKVNPTTVATTTAIATELKTANVTIPAKQLAMVDLAARPSIRDAIL